MKQDTGTQLGRRERQGHVRRKREGMRYIYTPAVAPAKARQSALRQLVSTLFEGSPMAAALLEMSGEQLSADERDQLSVLIARCEREGR